MSHNEPLKNLGYILFNLNYFLWMFVITLHHLPVNPIISDTLALKMEYVSIIVAIILFVFGFTVRINREATIENVFVGILIICLGYDALRAGGGVVGPLQAITFFASAINIPVAKISSFLKHDIICRIIILIYIIFMGHGEVGYYGVGYAGFVNINLFGMWIVVLIVEFYLLLQGKYLKYWFIISALAVGFSFYVGSSRSAILSFIIALIIAVLLFNKKVKRIVSYLWIIVPLIIVTFYLNISYFSSNFIYELNNLFSDRINMAQTILNQYKIGTWGQRIELVSRSNAITSFGRLKYLVLDNSYLTLLLMVGLVATVLIMALMLRGSYSLFYKFKSYAILPVVFFSFLGVSENNAIMIEYNFLFIVMGTLLLNKKQESL